MLIAVLFILNRAASQRIRGTLDGAAVLEVVDEGDELAHVLSRQPEAATVKGVIDWTRRFDHMQQHTGQHLLSAAFEKIGDYRTISFHMGAETSTIDLDSDRVGASQIQEAQGLANEVVFEDRAVKIFSRPVVEAKQMDLRRPTLREGEARLVQIEDFDLSACGGTHVRRTGAVGLIVVRKVERTRGQTRVEFVCGSRALKNARQDFRILSETARVLSGSLEHVPALITRQSEQLRAALRASEKQARRLAEYRARELWLAAPEREGRKIVRHIFAAEESLEAKRVAHAIAEQPVSVALLGVMGKPATLYFSQSAGGPCDMGGILRQVAGRFSGKGGDGRDFAQGGGVEDNWLEEALAFAESLL